MKTREQYLQTRKDLKAEYHSLYAEYKKAKSDFIARQRAFSNAPGFHYSLYVDVLNANDRKLVRRKKLIDVQSRLSAHYEEGRDYWKYFRNQFSSS